MKKLTKALAMGVFAMTAVGAANAATSTSSFTVTANVQAVCIVEAADLAFGAYSPSATAALTQTSTITVTCTNGTGYAVSLGDTPDNRTMLRVGGGSTPLGYGMFADAGHTAPFSVTNVSGIGAGQSYTVYGQIPAQQNVQAGDYSATVTVTVTY